MNLEEKVQISIKNVDPDLLKKARILAIEQGRNLSEVIRELMKEWVKDQEQEAKLRDSE